MDVINIKNIFLMLLFTLSAGCSYSIDSYNNSLLEYEHKIDLCREKRNAPFTDKKPVRVSEQDIRAALSYFIVKTVEDCVELEKLVLITALEKIIEDHQVAELIRYNAKNLLESFSDDQKILVAEHKKFIALAPSIQKQLMRIQASSRPFDPLMAVEHYIDESQ